MTRTTLAAMTVITLGFASGAFAQETTVLPMNPLDPVSRAAMLATRSTRPIMTPPPTTPSNVVVFLPTPEMPAPAPQPQLARNADSQGTSSRQARR